MAADVVLVIVDDVEPVEGAVVDGVVVEDGSTTVLDTTAPVVGGAVGEGPGPLTGEGWAQPAATNARMPTSNHADDGRFLLGVEISTPMGNHRLPRTSA